MAEAANLSVSITGDASGTYKCFGNGTKCTCYT